MEIKLNENDILYTRLIDLKDGWVVITYQPDDAQKLSKAKPQQDLSDINLQVDLPPDIRTKFVLIIKKVDKSLFNNTPDQIKHEIYRSATFTQNKISEIVPLPQFDMLKIRLTTIDVADKLKTQGFRLFRCSVAPWQIENERHTKLAQCMICYSYDHTRGNCNQTTTICSECASTTHRWDACPGDFKKCALCLGPHRTFSNTCPRRKDAVKRANEMVARKAEEKAMKPYTTILEQHTTKTIDATKKSFAEAVAASTKNTTTTVQDAVYRGVEKANKPTQIFLGNIYNTTAALGYIHAHFMNCNQPGTFMQHLNNWLRHNQLPEVLALPPDMPGLAAFGLVPAANYTAGENSILSAPVAAQAMEPMEHAQLPQRKRQLTTSPNAARQDHSAEDPQPQAKRNTTTLTKNRYTLLAEREDTSTAISSTDEEYMTDGATALSSTSKKLKRKTSNPKKKPQKPTSKPPPASSEDDASSKKSTKSTRPKVPPPVPKKPARKTPQTTPAPSEDETFKLPKPHHQARAPTPTPANTPAPSEDETHSTKPSQQTQQTQPAQQAEPPKPKTPPPRNRPPKTEAEKKIDLKLHSLNPYQYRGADKKTVMELMVRGKVKWTVAVGTTADELAAALQSGELEPSIRNFVKTTPEEYHEIGIRTFPREFIPDKWKEEIWATDELPSA